MHDRKKYLSLLVTIGLLLGAAWVGGRLLDILLNISLPMSVALILAVELLVVFSLHKQHVTVKSVFGMVFLIMLTIALGIGLLSASQHLIAWLTGDSLGTSFPWYTGFAFSFLIIGPVLLVAGIIWIVLHLRERKRNVRDIRLITQLMLIGTALWAVVWTMDRIWHCFARPHAYNYPWYYSFVFCLLYFGPGLLIEGGLLALFLRQEKSLTPEELSEPAPDWSRAPVSFQIHWRNLLMDSTVVIIPLILLAVLTAVLWGTGYLLENIALVVCSTLTVCLTIGVPAWLVCQRFGAGRLRDMWYVTVALLAVTVAAMVVWTFWYTEKWLDGLTGLPANWVYILALSFFGPAILGEGVMLILLRRVERRLHTGSTEEQRNGIWVLVLTAVLVLESVMLWGQFTDMEYKDELDVTISEVTNPNSAGDDHIVVTVKADYDVRWIQDCIEHYEGDNLYLSCTTTWNPIREIGERQVGWYLYPAENVNSLYVYKPGIGYQLILVKDQETGFWDFHE